jgi:outer membrane lipoprotein LolB
MLKTKPHFFSLFRQTIFFKLFILAACGALLSACSTPPTISKEQSSKPRVLQEQVQLAGRISIQYQQREQTETISAGFEWQQVAHDLHISLSSPLGQTIATIQQTPMGAILEQAKQEPRTATDIEQLLADSLGWSIPVIGLKGWLQGFDIQANGKAVAVPVKDYFQLQAQGWQLQFVSWQEHTGIVHPKRIDLQRHTEEIGEVKIRIVIDEWK